MNADEPIRRTQGTSPAGSPVGDAARGSDAVAGRSPAPRPERRPQAVIFDMDGLMLDTERVALVAWQEASVVLDLPFDPGLAKRMIGRNHADCRMLILQHYGDDFPIDDLLAATGQAYEAIVAREGIALKQGLTELIDWLEENGIARAVATSTRRSRAVVKLERAGLLHRFRALVGGDEIARGKPAPDIFLAAAGRLEADAAACLVLEDSEPGVHAALAAGIAPIMVPDLHPPSADLLALSPLVLPSLIDVRLHLSSLPS
jgi:HAD superfamily hydrolase (TIGR01509 family)